MDTFKIVTEGDVRLDVAKLCRDLNAKSKRRFMPGQPVSFPQEYYDKFKRQYDGLKILQTVESKTMTITANGLYAPDVNYVIGMSFKNSSIVSLEKLFVPNNHVLSYQRVLKEMLHQLGYLSGLNKCPDPKCIMAPSSSPKNVDDKTDFCRSCSISMSMYGVEL